MTYQEESEYLQSLEVYWNYKSSKNLWSNSCINPPGKRRIVNQNEIIEFIRLNPGYSESEIFEEVYNFTRGGIFSNKKYADCLRRAMKSRKIWRVKGKYKNESGRKLYRYYFMPEILK
jgi:hypothetical protein